MSGESRGSVITAMDILRVNFPDDTCEEIESYKLEDSELWELLVNYHRDVVFDATRKCYYCLEINCETGRPNNSVAKKCNCKERKEIISRFLSGVPQFLEKFAELSSDDTDKTVESNIQI